MQEAVETLSWPVYYFHYIFAKVFYLVFHIPMLIYFWGKGKTVPPIKNELLLKSANKLAEEIREGKIKSEDVIRAYIARILEVEPFIHALVENRFTEALEEAKEVDKLIQLGQYSKQQLEQEKPLLGVPLTVKVLLQVKGMHSNGASVLFKDAIAAEDAPTVALLRKAGAIVLGVTNSAELGLGFETNNPLYGQTYNPYDTHRTPGGSSGGESAILGSAGSVIGIGNDIQGSVRVPAHFNGIFSHKASVGLISNAGSFPYPNSKTSKFLFTGPMCRYSEDLITMCNILTVGNGQKIKFGQPVDFKRLKIFYQIDMLDPTVQKVDKEITDAMKMAMDYFTEKYGTVVEETNIPLLNRSNLIAFNLLIEHIPDIAETATCGKVKNFNGILELIKYVFGKSNHSLYGIFEMGFGKTPLFYNEENMPLFNALLQKLHEQFSEILDENSVFFFPTFPFVAPRPFEMLPLIFSTNFTGIFNILGLPATQVPLGLNSQGLPLGMQVIGKMNNDPLSVAVVHELSRAFGGWSPPS